MDVWLQWYSSLGETYTTMTDWSIISQLVHGTLVIVCYHNCVMCLLALHALAPSGCAVDNILSQAQG